MKNMYKKILILFIALVMVAAASDALTLKASQPSVEKGNPINLTGNCDAGLVHNISGEIGGKKIFEEQINCFDGKFEFNYKTGFLDPSGNWTITLFTEQSESEIIVQVNPVPASAFYRITFLSPAAFTFSRSETVFISVEVADAGKAVDEADVIIYDVFGRRINLKPEGNGIYDLNYAIPFDAPLGPWDLIVTSQKEVDGRLFGGERKISTEVAATRFTFDVLEPKQTTFEQSDPIPFRIKVSYPNGSRLTGEKLKKAEIKADNYATPMAFNSDNELVLSYTSPVSGNKIMTVYVEDTSGNIGEEKLELAITCSITCFAKSYGLIIAVVLLLAIVIGRLFYMKTKNSLELIQLKKEKEKAVELIKNLQREYFEKGVMPAPSYKRNLAMYKARLIDLDQKIKQAEKKLEAQK